MGLRIDDASEGGPAKAPSGDGPRAGRRASLTRTVLDTLEAEARDQRKLEERLAAAKWLILPDSRFLILWLSMIGPLIVYNVIWVPLEVSQMARSDRVHGQIDFILDFFFYFDIMINFRTAFLDKENELVLDWKQIGRRYFYGWFFLDFVATVQWEVLFSGGRTPFDEGAENSGGGAFQVLRLPRLLRLLRLFKKLDKFPQLKIAKLLFLLFMVAHWVGCFWFLIGFWSIEVAKAPNCMGDPCEGISATGMLRTSPQAALAFASYQSASDSAFGDSWLLRHFGDKNIEGKWRTPEGLFPPVAETVAYQNAFVNRSEHSAGWHAQIEVSQLYFTSIYWSLTMLMKSPHIGPDTWIEKFFGCLMVLLGLFVTTQLVAVVTQVVMSFDKAHSAFRDRQQEYNRFAASRSLATPLRKKLLSYSLLDWSVNQGTDPLEVIKSLGLPPALTHSMLAAIYDDVVHDSPLLRVIDTPVLHELLKYMKVVVSLQKETLINQSDPCTRLYLLRTGSLQASATDKLMREAMGKDEKEDTTKKTKKMGKGNRQQSNWKAKMQVRMIERPGDVICCANPYDPPQPLPFQVTSLKKTTLLTLHLQDLHGVLDMVSEEQTQSVCKAIHAEHRNILLSVMPKGNKGANAEPASRESRNESLTENSIATVGEQKYSNSDPLSEQRLNLLENEIDRCISSMSELYAHARCIPRMVDILAKRQGKPMPKMPAAAMKALDGGANGVDADVDALMGDASGKGA